MLKIKVFINTTNLKKKSNFKNNIHLIELFNEATKNYRQNHNNNQKPDPNFKSQPKLKLYNINKNTYNYEKNKQNRNINNNKIKHEPNIIKWKWTQNLMEINRTLWQTKQLYNIKEKTKIKYWPKYKKHNTTIHYHPNVNALLLLKSGDIESNLSPMLNILEIHPPSHRRRYKTCFITCTIELQLEYQHLAKKFASILRIDHSNHINATTNFPNLTRYLNNKRQHPKPRILFALITTISPNINLCKHQLINIPNPDWTLILLEKMTTLQNPLERHINTPHPYTQLICNHNKIINPPLTIHKKYMTLSDKHQN